jgi:dTDP-4-dehydrorhamnose 3,5-epimerase
MRFRATPIAGAFMIEIEPSVDARGFFARTWCAREFAEQGLPDVSVQTSISRNERRGTVRGMHSQLPPSREAKLVRCTRGAIYDVIVDLRPDSPTYLEHFGVELAARAYDALFIPSALLHGFQTLEPESEVHYQMSDFYAPELGFGARWDDPAFGIAWPITEAVTLLPRDAGYPDFDDAAYRARFAAATSATRVA